MPKVSIIIPCYNEQNTIRLLLQALRDQTFPSIDAEVIISDGLSTDGTRAEIAAFQKEFPDLALRVVDNTLRTIPSAVNRALEASRGEIIVRLDAHSQPYPDYVEKCVTLLEAGVGDNVGGVWEIQPGANTWIASAMSEEDRAVAEEGTIEERARDGSPYRLRLVAHDPNAYDWFYNVVSNPTLWFLQHYLWDLVDRPNVDQGLHHAWDEGYVPVNRAFAEATVGELGREPGAAVFFHDYHLYLAPRLVRAALRGMPAWWWRISGAARAPLWPRA